VIIPDDLALPDKVQTHFEALDPRPDQAGDFYAPLRDGSLERVLPSGEYEFYGEFRSFDGEGFDKVGPTIATTVAHGEVVRQTLDFSN
jgi:hypothetical protein